MAMVITVLVLLSASVAGAAYTLYTNRGDFETALAGSLVSTDLDSYAHGTSLAGVALISGLNVTSNMSEVIAWDPGASGDVRIAGFDVPVRQSGTAYYDINLTLPYMALGFDIEAWDPCSTAAIVTVSFADTTTLQFSYTKLAYIPEEVSVFLGIISDVAVSKVHWQEGLEPGTQGNEEVGFDNFAVARVPEPGMLALVGLGALIFRSRRIA